MDSRAYRRTGGAAAPRFISRATILATVVASLLVCATVRPAGAGPVVAPSFGKHLPVIRKASTSSPFRICEDQTYALCATAQCFVFNGVAYCKCDVEHGDSISEAFEYDDGKDVCTANAEGVENGYMISTYSLPPQIVAPSGDLALYTCGASSSNGAYAQCDGGICFTSTEGKRFPGFAEPLAEDEIMCSCPITVANPETAKIGFQIVGPYPCEQSFFDNCKNPPAGSATGDTIYVGAPTGAGRFLTELLYGTVPPLHLCAPQGTESSRAAAGRGATRD